MMTVRISIEIQLTSRSSPIRGGLPRLSRRCRRTKLLHNPWRRRGWKSHSGRMTPPARTTSKIYLKNKNHQKLPGISPALKCQSNMGQKQKSSPKWSSLLASRCLSRSIPARSTDNSQSWSKTIHETFTQANNLQ